MKQTIKLLFSFLGGIVAATALISLIVPPQVLSSRTEIGPVSPIWSLEDFETINDEISEMVDDPAITMTVIPISRGNGYEIVVFDRRIRARFGFTSWDSAIERVENRMDQLREDQDYVKAVKAAQGTGGQAR